MNIDRHDTNFPKTLIFAHLNCNLSKADDLSYSPWRFGPSESHRLYLNSHENAESHKMAFNCMISETDYLEKSSYQQRNVRGNSSTRSIFEGQTNWIGKANQSKYPSDSEPHITVLKRENITIQSSSVNDRRNPRLDGLDTKRSSNFLHCEPFIFTRLDGENLMK